MRSGVTHRAACYYAMYRAYCSLLPVQNPGGVTPKRISRATMEVNTR